MRRRIVIIVLVIVGVLLLSGAGAWLWQTAQDRADNASNQTTDVSSPEFQAYVSEVSDKAANASDTKSATKIFDDAIQEANTKDAKARLYAEKATVLIDNDKEAAQQAAEDAKKLDSSNFETLFLIAATNEQLGNKAVAAEYYRKVAAVVPEVSDANPTSYGRQYYLDLAAELEK